jgi:serine/threonine-protein kinase HipA
VMGRNCDDHAKNFAFTMDKTGQWALAPAFDVCHAYRPGSDWVSQHALSINGKRTNIQKSDLLSVAHQMNVKKAKSIIPEIAEVISNWDKYAEKVGVEKKLQAAIGKTLQVIV